VKDDAGGHGGSVRVKTRVSRDRQSRRAEEPILSERKLEGPRGFEAWRSAMANCGILSRQVLGLVWHQKKIEPRPAGCGPMLCVNSGGDASGVHRGPGDAGIGQLRLRATFGLRT